MLVVTPIAVAQIARRWQSVKDWSGRHKSRLGELAQVGILGMVLVGAGGAGEKFQELGDSRYRAVDCRRTGDSFGAVVWRILSGETSADESRRCHCRRYLRQPENDHGRAVCRASVQSAGHSADGCLSRGAVGRGYIGHRLVATPGFACSAIAGELRLAGYFYVGGSVFVRPTSPCRPTRKAII